MTSDVFHFAVIGFAITSGFALGFYHIFKDSVVAFEFNTVGKSYFYCFLQFSYPKDYEHDASNLLITFTRVYNVAFIVIAMIVLSNLLIGKYACANFF
jgi:hypothetical protein